MASALKHPALYSICSLALFIFGCPKRQTGPRLIYVPSPPPAASASSQPATGTLVIPAPPPPEPVAVAPAPEPPKPKPVRRHRRAVPAQAETAEPEPAPPEAPVPALEPRESPQRQGALRRQIIQLHAGIEGRMAQLHPAALSAQDKRTLDDAQSFLSQSQRALVDGDLTRALNLARKASLLVDSLVSPP